MYPVHVECSPVVRETGVQSQIESYQRLRKWYLMLPCLTLSIIRYGFIIITLFFHCILSYFFMYTFPILNCPVGWGCRIHRLLLCRGVRPPPRVSWIWHYTIWWWGSSNAGALGNAEYPFIAIAPRSTLARSGSTW